MADYIDRQTAIRAVMDLPDCPNGYSDTYDKACIVGMLEEVPSIDAVEVVRCKDCKHNPKDAWFGCPMSHMTETQKPDTAWCWKGERKDGNV